MNEIEFQISGAYIQLNQLLKAIGWAESGSEANSMIDEGLVKVNGKVELRRRNKILPGFRVQYGDEIVVVCV
jgi:ribosome-associated protein